MENEFKLIKLSRNSWHYKLMKWFLGDNTPSPSNTFNFCRYFWILMFCLLIMVPIVAPVKLLFNLIVVIISGIEEYLSASLDRGLERWSESLDRMSVFDVYYEGVYEVIPRKYRKNRYLGLSDNIIASWAKRELNLNWFDSVDKEKIHYELLKIKEERDALSIERAKLRMIREEKERENAEKREKLIKKINNKLSFISDAWDSSVSAIRKIFSFDATKMINIAKKTFGVLLTIIFLVASYFIVNLLSLSLISLVSLIISYWDTILIAIGVLVILAILGFLAYLLVNKVAYLIDKIISTYKRGGSVWYIQVFYIAIVKPLYYIVYKPIFWLVMIPINFIFHHFLWNLVVLRWIVPFFKWIWNGLVKFTGIFGIYFSASKGDYCPGIEWDEE